MQFSSFLRRSIAGPTCRYNFSSFSPSLRKLHLLLFFLCSFLLLLWLPHKLYSCIFSIINVLFLACCWFFPPSQQHYDKDCCKPTHLYCPFAWPRSIRHTWLVGILCVYVYVLAIFVAAIIIISAFSLSSLVFFCAYTIGTCGCCCCRF